MKLLPIPSTPDYLETYEPHFLPFLPLISKKSRVPVTDLLDDIRSGRVQIHFAWDQEKAHALAGTRIVARGPDRIGVICWLTGSGREAWTHLLPELERYLKEHMRCAGVRADARIGWSRTLREHGYRLTHVSGEKDFS